MNSTTVFIMYCRQYHRTVVDHGPLYSVQCNAASSQLMSQSAYVPPPPSPPTQPPPPFTCLPTARSLTAANALEQARWETTVRHVRMAIISVGVLNAALNAGLWLVHWVVTLVVERVYVAHSRYQLHRRGRTHATNSDEVHLSHWVRDVWKRRRGRRPSTTKSAWWLFALVMLLALLLPAELVFETGLGERVDCQVRVFERGNGVCATPWDGHSDVGIAASALLVQRFAWVQQIWNVVFEGSSKDMIASESRSESTTGLPYRPVLGRNCKVRATNGCGKKDCGEMIIDKDGGAFDTIVSHATFPGFPQQNTSDEKALYVRGDITYDGVFGLGFFFWERKIAKEARNQPNGTFRIAASGIETVLSEADIDRILDVKQTSPWNLNVVPSLTRLYDLTCDTSGLKSRDLTRAVSLYRTMQMEQPGVKRMGMDFNIDQLSPISSSDVLKALFALKAEDGGDVCAQKLEEYSTCGEFDFSRSAPFIAIAAVLLVLWLLSIFWTWSLPKLYVPHDATSWREFSSGEKSRADASADYMNGGMGGFRDTMDVDLEASGFDMGTILQNGQSSNVSRSISTDGDSGQPAAVLALDSSGVCVELVPIRSTPASRDDYS